MKAQMCRAFDGLGGLRWEAVARPDPGPGQVLIKTSACGVNFPDSLIVEGKYQIKPELPFSPGFEVAGVVESVGDGVELPVGSRVAAHPRFGSYAEYVVVESNRVFVLPDEVDERTAAAMVVNYGTSLNALKRRGALKRGESLLVLGAAGGVGLAAVELGVAMGANVIAAASTDEKLELCAARGAHALINYRRDDLRSEVDRLTEGRGLDVVYDPVGGQLAESMVRSLRCDGRYLVVGFASGEIPSIRLNLPLLKIASIVGVFWGSWIDMHPEAAAVDMAELFELAAKGKVSPFIDETYDLADAALAIGRVAARQSKGKIVLTTTSGIGVGHPAVASL